VVWINSDMQVVDKVLARSWRPAYFSKQPAKYVLESIRSDGMISNRRQGAIQDA
jgi:hypothetical protein